MSPPSRTTGPKLGYMGSAPEKPGRTEKAPVSHYLQLYLCRLQAHPAITLRVGYGWHKETPRQTLFCMAVSERVVSHLVTLLPSCPFCQLQHGG